MSQIIDWLNENEHRSYPLLDGVSKAVSCVSPNWSRDLPDDFLIDLQLQSAFQLSAPVYLKNITVSVSGNVTVLFGTPSTNITSFTIPSAATYPKYMRNSDGCLAVFGLGVLAFLAPTDDSPTPPTSVALTANIPIEPSTCVEFHDAWLGVQSIKTSPQKDWVSSPSPHLIDSATQTSLVGDIKFLEGYNFRLLVSDNLIDLEVGASYGLRMSCGSSFIDPAYLDCASLVFYINGVPPDANGDFNLIQGTNVVITPGNALAADFQDPQQEIANSHSLFVGLTFDATDICAPINITPSI
jgi:hypothetical protein